MKKIVIYIIKKYQQIFSPDTGVLRRTTAPTCSFYPTCSQYTIEAVEKYGVTKGLYKGFRRVLRCTPWNKQHIDEV